jgi:UDP-glucose 4-epimerase
VVEGNATGERALVAGATGFIGSNLMRKLASTDLELHALSRNREPGQDGAVRWWRGDITDRLAVAKVFAAVQPQIVFNVAGETHAARELRLVRPTFDANLAGTVNLLAAAADVGSRRVVLTGSLEEPGDASSGVPSSPYAASKWASNLYAGMFNEVFGLSVVTLRVFMVYGPAQRDVAKLIPYTILALLRGEAPELTSGTREVDWVYVDDVADAYLTAAYAEDVDGAMIDVGSGELHSVREIVERLTSLVAPAIEPLFGAVDDRASEEVRVADTDAASVRLGWRPTVALDDGLARTVDWYAQHHGEGLRPQRGDDAAR